jgi:hypothetical protein
MPSFNSINFHSVPRVGNNSNNKLTSSNSESDLKANTSNRTSSHKAAYLPHSSQSSSTIYSPINSLNKPSNNSGINVTGAPAKESAESTSEIALNANSSKAHLFSLFSSNRNINNAPSSVSSISSKATLYQSNNSIKPASGATGSKSNLRRPEVDTFNSTSSFTMVILLLLQRLY